MAQHLSLRKYFTGINIIDLLDLLGKAQMELEIQKIVTKVLRNQEQILTQHSGISLSTPGDDHDLKLYVKEVLEEVKRKKK